MNTGDLTIRSSKKSDLESILNIHRLAFNEEEVAHLTADLLNDLSAEPVQSLLALVNNEVAGHILFTRAYFKQEKKEQPVIYILAPLAVIPKYQHIGIGGKLIKTGLTILKEKGTDLVFVLGHKNYYPKYGFIPDAVSMGMPAPYEIPKKDWDAWMVQTLNGKSLSIYSGQIKCAEAMNKPEYWRE